jgi:hypothetical protein
MNLYIQQKVVVKVKQETSEESEIGRGVRQGCCLSPLLFSIYAEAMMLEAMEGIEEGVKVNGSLLKDVRFADDQGMVAGSESGLQKLMDGLVIKEKAYDMKVNIKKTKTMIVSKQNWVEKNGEKVKKEVNLWIEGQLIEQVSCFKYLGSTITEDGRSDKEIRIRIAMAKEAFSKRKELLTKKIKKSTKKKILKTLIWTVALYGSETWTLKTEEVRRLEALEMWLWRRMEKISWTDKITNEEVLRRVGEERQLLNLIRNRQKN